MTKKDYAKRCADLAYKSHCRYGTFTSSNSFNGNTAAKVIDISGIAENDVKIIFVSGRVYGMGQSLNDDDQITPVPATGGM
jgi:hypothetical protein